MFLPLGLATILLFLTNGCFSIGWHSHASPQLILIITVVNIINYNAHYDYGN